MRHLFLFLLVILLSVPVSASSKVGKPAPILTATLLNNEHYTLQQSQGHVVLVTFWATWCLPCMHELSELDRLYQTYHDEGLDILGVSVDDPAELAKVHTYTKNLHFPIAQLEQVNADGYGHIWAVPLLFVIDKHGLLREDGWPGLTKNDYPKLNQMVKSLLAEKIP